MANGKGRSKRTSLAAGPDAVIDFIYRHLEAGTFRKPVLEEWLRARVSLSPAG